MPTIQLKRLKQIVKEELMRKLLAEGELEKSAIDHASAATKCLDAIEKYKEVATSKALAEMQEELDSVEKILNRVVASPLQYADAIPESPGPDTEGDISISGAEGGVQKKSMKPNVLKSV